MPVKKCVKYGNRYYCFNKDSKTVSVFVEQIYQLNECPEYVLADLIAGKENAHIFFKPKTDLLSEEEKDIILKSFGENPFIKKS